MRLAYLAPEFLPTWGGVGTYSTELIKNLSKLKDMEIHVITPKRGDNYNHSELLQYFDNRIKIHNISSANDTFFYNFKFQYAVLKNFKKLNKKYNFDLVHAANLVHMPDIFLKFTKLGIPSITTVHTTLKSQSRINGKSKLNHEFGRKENVEKLTYLCYPYIQFLENRYLKRTKNLITVSNWIKGFIKENGNQKIEVIHNGVDVERFSRKNNNQDEFKFLNEVNKPVVLYCGRLLALKGLIVLIKSIKEIIKKEDAYFIFAGSGDIDKWKNELKKEGIPEKNYRFLGYVEYERIQHLYSKSDIFVLPSFTESFSLTLLEAMSVGLPVIASNVGGIPEMIENGTDGILVEAGNVAQLTESILRLLGDGRLRKKISKNGTAKVQKRFNSRLMAAKTRGFYENILGKIK